MGEFTPREQAVRDFLEKLITDFKPLADEDQLELVIDVQEVSEILLTLISAYEHKSTTAKLRDGQLIFKLTKI